MARFQCREIFHFRSKTHAKQEAKIIRANGFRATIKPANSDVKKKHPLAKWVVCKGQKRKH